MIDIHTHILPNIDDGANSVEEAYKMIESLYNQDIKKAVCTPHFDPTRMSLEDFISKRAMAVNQMRDSKVTLIPASETMFHEYLFHYSDLSSLCIENTKYLLLELPYISKWDEKFFKTLKSFIIYYDVIPIIAHIERYHQVKKKEKNIKKLIELGCLIQLNTTSVLDKKYKKRAFSYIKQGYIDVLGSDCHNMVDRYPVITEANDRIEQSLGVRYLEEFRQNALSIINGTRLRENIVFIYRI